MDHRNQLIGILRFLLPRTPEPNDALIQECLDLLKAPDVSHAPTSLCRACLNKLTLAAQPRTNTARLTPDLIDLLQAWERGETDVAYADRTGVTRSTMKSRTKAIFNLLGKRTHASALAVAIRAELL